MTAELNGFGAKRILFMARMAHPIKWSGWFKILLNAKWLKMR